jgi:hypothetical protein
MPEPDDEWKDLPLAELRAIVATFDTVHEAHLAASYLESQGIPARLVDDFLAGVATHLVPALGGIKLMVLPRHAERAARLVDDLRRNSSAPPEGSDENETDDMAEDAVGERRDPSDEPGLLAALVLLFAAPLPALRYSRRARRLALLLAFGAVLAITWLAEFFGCVDRRAGAGGGDPSEHPAEP